ncbi:ABC transporter permease subunit [Streptomyces sp. TS71-3]|uniref:ABC transporter permease subunit n=1 Tax=Streptomyces sp. TS71-3 TaxID=2733862 RepID=UPI001B06B8D9|nr:ABC transporter permease subunit [Streptomyces sp. TS71-3]GHJ38681.1 hypothetical protein Sm713_42900 [Streptomyces sp. TS71-3]
MSDETVRPSRSGPRPVGGGFVRLLHAEWTKFRTVRGWVLGMLAAVLLTVLFGALGSANGLPCGGGCDHTPPTGPGGEPVSDGFYFVHRPLTGDGSITARIASLTGRHVQGAPGPDGERAASTAAGVQPWAKAGLIVKDGTGQGSAYAAVLVTGGHGARMQYDYTGDLAGRPGRVTADSPRWLRLTRTGTTLTGDESADGEHWHTIGRVRLPGLPGTVRAGLFTTSPDYQVTSHSVHGASSRGGPTVATSRFDHVAFSGPAGSGAAGRSWSGTAVGGPSVARQFAGYRQDGGGFTVSGSGDIAPAAPGQGSGTRTTGNILIGAFAGLMAVIVVAALFVTAEYRRGLIRTTLLAGPRRGRALAAKATVIGAVAFLTGTAAAALTVPLVGALARHSGFYLYPVTAAAELRVILGTGALFGAAAVGTLAVGTLLRRGAAAVTVAVVAIVLPYVIAVASVLAPGPSRWLTRLTPAAAFAVQQTVPVYPQVDAGYTPADGYFPLSPWAGFAVLCGYAVLALALAGYAFRRRDA